MTSPRSSRRLSLKKRESDDGYASTNKRAKIDNSNEEITKQEKYNFMKLCLQVSYEAFLDVRKRFQVLDLPECINNSSCTHKYKKISTAAEGCIKIDQNSHAWCDALEVCIMCITTGQCLSGSILKSIVEIIMNAHDDINSGYTVDYILRQCQYTLLLNFSMHPPCYESITRDCYKEFLTTPMNEIKFSNRKDHRSDYGIVAHCFDRLMYEISIESKDGILIDNKDLNEVKDGVRRLHWKKENLELFEFLERTERINRLMMILESTIHLLQTDLALWYKGYHSSESKSKKRSKPIIGYLLWPSNQTDNKISTFKYGTVSLLCKQIMTLFIYFIHLRYPEEHITTMSSWMNNVAELFYIYENFEKLDYPSPLNSCIRFSQDFAEMIKPLPSPSILRILQRLQPTFMKYLVGEYYIQSLPHIPQKDITHIIKSCVEDSLWKKFPGGDGVRLSPDIIKNGKVKLCQLLNSKSKKCSYCKTFNFKSPGNDTFTNLYPKLELDLENTDKKIQRPHFVNVLFLTFVSYLESYNIKEFRSRLVILNGDNQMDWKPTDDYKITEQFVKKYTSIFSFLKVLIAILNGRKDKFSVTLSEIVKKYLS